MDVKLILHCLCIATTVLCGLTLFVFIFKKKWSLLRRINGAVYISMLGVYSLFSEFLVNYIHVFYNSNYTYNYTLSSIISAINLTSVLIVLIGLFLDKTKFEKIVLPVLKLVVFIIYVAIIASLITSKLNNKFFIPIILLSLMFVEHFLVNTTENLNSKFSINTYFTVNIVISVFWIISIVALCIKISFNFDIQLILLAILFILISFCSLYSGYKTIKKEN